jgi:hypothetical protein
MNLLKMRWNEFEQNGMNFFFKYSFLPTPSPMGLNENPKRGSPLSVEYIKLLVISCPNTKEKSLIVVHGHNVTFHSIINLIGYNALLFTFPPNSKSLGIRTFVSKMFT